MNFATGIYTRYRWDDSAAIRPRIHYHGFNSHSFGIPMSCLMTKALLNRSLSYSTPKRLSIVQICLDHQTGLVHPSPIIDLMESDAHCKRIWRQVRALCHRPKNRCRYGYGRSTSMIQKCINRTNYVYSRDFAMSTQCAFD